MEKVRQNTNFRHWASLWLLMAMAVMTAIFLRGGIVVQAEENDNSITNIKMYVGNVEQEDNDIYNILEGEQYTLRVEPESTYDGATYTYQWYEGEKLLEDQTSSEIIITKTEYPVDRYSVQITNDRGGTSGTEFVLYQKSGFNVSILSYINDEYYDNDTGAGCTYGIDRGQKAKLYVDAKISTGAKITYDWQKYVNEEEGYVSTGNTSDTYETDPIESKEAYRCVIHYKGGEETRDFAVGVKGQDEDEMDLSVSKYIKINGKKKNDPYWIEVKGGDNIILGITVSDLPYGVDQKDISYAWYKVTDDESEPKCLSTAKEYEISNISESEKYYCEVKTNEENATIEDFDINVNNFTGSVLFDGKKQKNDTLYVESLKDLAGKKLTVDASYPGVSDSVFSYRWHELDVEDEVTLSTSKECVLEQNLLSERALELGCEVTNTENGEKAEFQFGIYQEDYVDEGEPYINNENTYTEQAAEGSEISLKVVFPDNIADKVKYEWYDEEKEKMNCTSSEYIVTMGSEEKSYTCVVTNKKGYSYTYEFTLYTETKLVPCRYVNGRRLKGNGYSVGPNTSATMEVKVNSNDNVKYQWYKQNTYNRKQVIKGETNSTYTIQTDEGTNSMELYYCMVTRGNDREWVDFYIDTTDDVCNHTNTEVLPAVPATCEKDGLTEGKRCTECGEIIVRQEVVKATGHKWDNGKVTTPATTTATGVKTYTCSVCKKTKTEVIPKLPAKDDTRPGTTDNTTKQPGTTDNTTKQPEKTDNTTKQPGKTDNTTKQPAKTDNTTKKPATTKKALKTGTKITDKKSKAVYKVTANKTVQYTKASDKKAKKAKKVKVPSSVTVNGVKYQVTTIAANAFKNNKNLRSIVIPTSVKVIGKQAFAGCKNLKSITIKTPYLTKKSVGAKAFKGISRKATIKVPKKQLKAYRKLLKAKGVAKSVKIKS